MSTSEKEASFRSGFTWRVFAIMIFSAFVFVPVNMWVGISIGAGTVSDLAIVMVAAELARLFGSPLTMQEVATLLVGLGALNVNYGISRIRSAYFSQSALLQRYGLVGMIPYWEATLPESGFFASRSIWHPILRGTWLRLDNMILPGIASLAGLSLGILNKMVYVDQEKLPFPGVQIDAAFCSTVAERELSRLRIFSLSLLIAFTYGFLMYIMPYIFNLSLMPALYFDWSPWIQTLLPGACFGIATNLPTLLPGLYLSPTVIFSQLIGSIAVWVFGNWYVVTHGITEFSKIYIPGMPMRNIYQLSWQYVWMMPTIGLTILVGFTGLRPRALRQAYSAMRRAEKADKIEERVFSTWLFIVPFTCVILSNLLMIWYRAPDYPLFPWLPATYSIVISLAQSQLIGRAVGTGVNVDIPENLDKLILVSMNYKGFNGWLVSPVEVNPGFGGNVARNFKLAQLTRSSFGGLLKFHFIVGPISVVFALLFTQVLWSIAPIPSMAYEQSMVEWPRGVMNRAVWITRPEGIFELDRMMYGALAGLGLYVLLSLLRLPAATILISLLVGINRLPPMVMNMFIGFLLRLVLERIVGKETFRDYRFTIVAGISAGTGCAALIGVSGLLIQKSIILWS